MTSAARLPFPTDVFNSSDELDFFRYPFKLFLPYHLIWLEKSPRFHSACRAPPVAGLYRWLYAELRSAILDGRLRPGARLPATRDLAAAYDLSRATIVTAFDQLKSEGYVEGTVRALAPT